MIHIAIPRSQSVLSPLAFSHFLTPGHNSHFTFNVLSFTGQLQRANAVSCIHAIEESTAAQ